MSELIRPVIDTIEPVKTSVSTIYGFQWAFAVPSEAGVEVNITPGYLKSEVSVNITEKEGKKGEGELLLSVAAFPHMANPDLVTAYASNPREGALRGTSFSEREAISILDETPYKDAYTREAILKLELVEGLARKFIIGQKKDSLFVDGWLREAQAPSWRVHLPLKREGQGEIPAIIIPDARFLIFA